MNAHKYIARNGCLICSICGAAKHERKFDGFKYWFAGVGSEYETDCRPKYHQHKF